MNIPVTRFTHLHDTNSSYFYLGGKYYGVEELGAGPGKSLHSILNEEKLLEVYKLFNVKNVPRDDKTGRLLNPLALSADIIKSKLDLEIVCKKDRYFKNYLFRYI